MSRTAKMNAARHSRRGSAVERAAEYARLGHDTAAISRLLDVRPRTARGYLQQARNAGIATEPTDAPETAPSEPTRAPKRKEPAAFRRKRARGSLPEGRVLRPILLYDDAGGFGIRETVSAAGLGPNVPIGESDEFGRVKLSERVIDMGTTLKHDERRYADARSDESIDLPDEFPEGATRIIVTRELPDGSVRDFEGEL